MNLYSFKKYRGRGIAISDAHASLVVALFSGLSASGQYTTSGTVTGESRTGMPGVKVLIRNTPSGTTTNAEGKYSISLPEDAGEVPCLFVHQLSRSEEPVRIIL